MTFFDFHHHHSKKQTGIYNLKFQEEPPAGLFSAGIHPDSISDGIEDQFLWLKDISTHKKCAAIGECGLDGLIQVEEKLQEEVFERQIFWANEIRKPVIIHCVRRFSRLSYFKKLAEVPLIIHGFNKKKTVGAGLVREDFYLSFGQSLLYNVNLQKFFQEVPRDKFFLETDSADFPVEDLYRKVAALKNLSLEELTGIINGNLQHLKISM